MGIPKPLPKEQAPGELRKILLRAGQPLSTPRIWNMGANIIPRMELRMVIALSNLVNRINDTLQIEPDLG